MKITTLTIAVLAGLLLPALVEGGPLSLRYFKCEIGAACRDYDSSGDSDGTFAKSTKTLFDCAEECDDKSSCYGFEWRAPDGSDSSDDSGDDGECEHHTVDGQDFSSSVKNDNLICCWKKKSHKSKSQ